MHFALVKKIDPAVCTLIMGEKKRQDTTLMLIPSENYASRAVEEAMSSSFGNKYAEGYPGRRYYQGNEYADQLEQLCIDRAKELFHVPFVNVQPHSGSPANFAVQTAVMQPGEVYMGLSLASGGHLSHGARLTAGSKFFHAIQYDVRPDGYLDFAQIERLAREHKPKLIIAGTTAYPRTIDWKKFRQIADRVGALLQADIAHIAGLIVAGVYPSPVPYVDIITTTTHKSLRGPRGAMIMVTSRGLKKDPELDKKINSAIIPGIQGGPHLNSIAALTVALKEAGTARFKKYGAQIVKNAIAMAEVMKTEGFALVTDGTDSHLILASVAPFRLLGNTMAEACEAAGLVLNRNAVPFDPNPPFYPSGIRLGTPAVTSRGMKEKHMKLIGSLLGEVARSTSHSAEKLGLDIESQKKADHRARILAATPVLKRIRTQVAALCKAHPIPEVY